MTLDVDYRDQLVLLRTSLEMGLLTPVEAQVRVTELVEASGSRLLRIEGFLAEKGFSGFELMRVANQFAPCLRRQYRAVYRHAPLFAREWSEGNGWRPVYAYIEADRVPVFDAAFELWSA